MADCAPREASGSGPSSRHWLERAGVQAEMGSATGLVLFDGDCGFCRRAILALARADAAAKLRFCALGSSGGRRVLSALGESETDRFMLVTDQDILKDADAYVGILRRLHRKLPARLLEGVPRPLRNLGYGLIARNRWLLSRLISAPEGDLSAITDRAASRPHSDDGGMASAEAGRRSPR